MPEQILTNDDHLRERCQSLRAAMDDLQSTLETLRGQTASFREKIRSANRERAVAKRETSLLRDGIFRVSSVLREVESRFAHLKPRLERAVSERDALLGSRNAQVARLKELIAQREAAEARLGALRARMAVDNAAIAELDPRVAAYRECLPAGEDDRQFRSDDFLAEAMAILRKRGVLAANLDQARGENAALVHAKTTLEAAVAEAERKVERLFACRTFFQQRADLDQSHGRLEEVLAQATAAVEETLESAQARRQAISEVRRAVSELQEAERSKLQVVGTFLSLKQAVELETSMRVQADQEEEEARANLASALRLHTRLQRQMDSARLAVEDIMRLLGVRSDVQEAM